MGIVRKNFLIVSSMMSVTILIILAIIYFSIPLYYTEARKHELEEKFDYVLHMLEDSTAEELPIKAAELDAEYANLWLTLYAEDGQIAYPVLANGQLDSDVAVYLDNNEHTELGAWSHSFYTTDQQKFSLLGEYAFPSISENRRMLVRAYPQIFLIILCLTSGVGYVYSRGSAKRIQALSQTTQRMIRLDQSASCPSTGKDEISILGQDINLLYTSLLNSIEDLRLENERKAEKERRQAEFIRMSSHELKTPIASLTGIIEGMIYKVGDFKDRDKYLRQCQTLLDEQTKVVQSILEASTFDMTLPSQQTSFSLKELLEEMMPTYQLLARTKQYQFQVTLREYPIVANRLYLSKALKNIIDNAFRYTPEKGKIAIYMQGHQLIIDNEVEHLLSKEQIELVFKPFYRPDYSRSRKDGGTGLGLYIVQQIFDKHQIGYQLQAISPHTMRFTIDFKVVSLS